MEFEAKVVAARRFLAARGVAPGSVAPPLFRLCWRLGIEVAPPHFRRFGANALTLGGFFGVAWSLCMGLLMGLGVLPHRPMPMYGLVGGCLLMMVVSGALFGLAMAFHYQRDARRHRVPAWPAFDPDLSAG